MLTQTNPICTAPVQGGPKNISQLVFVRTSSNLH